MTQQIGKHNASGPTARRRDGTIDPSGYLKARLSDRRNLGFHGVLLLGWGVIFGVRGGSSLPFVLVMVAVLVAAELGVAYAVHFALRARERRRRERGMPPSWAGVLIAVLQAREAGFDFPSSYRNDAVVRGRLKAEADTWVWVGSPSRRRPDPATITFGREWRPAMSARIGSRQVVTFQDSSARRLDIGIGDWRDLSRYLKSRG